MAMFKLSTHQHVWHEEELAEEHKKEDEDRENERRKNDPLFCVPCKLQCYSAEYMQKHLRGKKHRDQTKKMSEPVPHPGTSSSFPMVHSSNSSGDIGKVEKVPDGKKKCTCCQKNIALSNWSKHIKTSKHLKLSKRSEPGSGPASVVVEEPVADFACLQCNISFKRKSNLEKHLKSNKHARFVAGLPSTPTGPGTGSGNLFLVTLPGAKKYKVLKKCRWHFCKRCLKSFVDRRLLDIHKRRGCLRRRRTRNKINHLRKLKKRLQLIRSIAIGNEFGINEVYPHVHFVVKWCEFKCE